MSCFSLKMNFLKPSFTYSYINAKGSLIDEHTVKIEGKGEKTANHIVIATGGRPMIPYVLDVMVRLNLYHNGSTTMSLLNEIYFNIGFSHFYPLHSF